MAEVKMYSVHPDTGETIVHRLPWDKDSAQLNIYLRKGFTFEPPSTAPTVSEEPVIMMVPDEINKATFFCAVCGADFSHRIALTGHMRSHKE